MDFERDDVTDGAGGQRLPTPDGRCSSGRVSPNTSPRKRCAARSSSRGPCVPGSRLVFTYVRQDFIDGTNLHGAEAVYRKFRRRRQVWKSGMAPENVEEILRGLRLARHRAGRTQLLPGPYIRPTGRNIGGVAHRVTALAIGN